MNPSPRPPHSLGLTAPAKNGVIDPVCGMTVDPAHAAATVEHEGKTYYFCAASCAQKFRAQPQRYLQGQPAHEPMTPAPAPPGGAVEYICPMDPEVHSDHPGPCPICGMALEPRTVTAEALPSAEEKLLLWPFYVSLAITVPLLVLASGPMLPGCRWPHPSRLPWSVQFGL